MSTPPTRDHVVEFVDGENLSSTKRIAASYFTLDEDLVILKDGDHKTVFVLHLDRLVYIQRIGQADETEAPKVV